MRLGLDKIERLLMALIDVSEDVLSVIQAGREGAREPSDPDWRGDAPPTSHAGVCQCPTCTDTVGVDRGGQSPDEVREILKKIFSDLPSLYKIK